MVLPLALAIHSDASAGTLVVKMLLFELFCVVDVPSALVDAVDSPGCSLAFWPTARICTFWYSMRAFCLSTDGAVLDVLLLLLLLLLLWPFSPAAPEPVPALSSRIIMLTSSPATRKPPTACT